MHTFLEVCYFSLRLMTLFRCMFLLMDLLVEWRDNTGVIVVDDAPSSGERGGRGWRDKQQSDSGGMYHSRTASVEDI